MTTAAVADQVSDDPRRVYRDCRRLEEFGWLRSRLVRGERRLLFCLDCKTVVTNETYAECRGHDLRPFFPRVREWRLTTAGYEALRSQRLPAAA